MGNRGTENFMTGFRQIREQLWDLRGLTFKLPFLFHTRLWGFHPHFPFSGDKGQRQHNKPMLPAHPRAGPLLHSTFGSRSSASPCSRWHPRGARPPCSTQLLLPGPGGPHAPPANPSRSPLLTACKFQASIKSFLNLVTRSLAALKLVLQAAWAPRSLLKEQGRGGKRGGLPNRSYYLPGLCKPFGICFEKLSARGAADASLSTVHGCSGPGWVKAAPGKTQTTPLLLGGLDQGRAAWSVPLLRTESWDLGVVLLPWLMQCVWGLELAPATAWVVLGSRLGEARWMQRVAPQQGMAMPSSGDPIYLCCNAEPGWKSPVTSRSISRTVYKGCRRWESQPGSLETLPKDVLETFPILEADLGAGQPMRPSRRLSWRRRGAGEV